MHQPAFPRQHTHTSKRRVGLSLSIAATLCLSPLLSLGAELTAADAATYELLGPAGRPTGMQMRLSKNGPAWAMEGKTPEGSWKSLSCDRGCELRASTAEEADAYLAAFAPTLREHTTLACIQNTAAAFCRLTKNEAPSKVGYVYVALVTGRPIPMPLQRLAP